jgi:protein-S-isoprenylcysteine O-methyltransferase Ste14
MSDSSSRPAIFAIVFLAATTVAYLIVPVVAWGSPIEFLGHPARAGLYLVGIVATLSFFFSGVNFSSLRSDDVVARRVLAILSLVALAICYFPTYADRREIAVWDGDLVRYLGLAVYAIGCVLRIGPMFALKKRFGAPWVDQSDHYLVTTGFYRYIRHPSYLGQLLIVVGWFLVFRCWIGAVLCCVAVPFGIPQIRKEEAKLLAEFGESYRAYQKRTWI